MTIWYCQPFDQLSTHTLYDLLKLRCDVFLIEQNCLYHELDNLDQLPSTQHLYAMQDHQIIAYARLLGKDHDCPSHSRIGRVLVAPSRRKEKMGHQLVSNAIQQAFRLWPNTSIKISAQSHLERFYQSHGFINASEPYMEDGIKHQLMILEAETQA